MLKNYFCPFPAGPRSVAGKSVSSVISAHNATSRRRKALKPIAECALFSRRFRLWFSAAVFALACLEAKATVVPDVVTSFDQSRPGTVVKSTAFTTKSGQELLLAFVATDSITTPNVSVQSVAGGGLTWVLVERTNTQLGTAEIWRAFAPSVLTNVSVSATLSQRVVSSITVESFAGVNVSGTNGSGAIGAIASGHASTGAPAASLVATQDDSLVIGVGNDYDQAIARTPDQGQALIHQFLSPTGDTYWVQRVTAQTALKGTRITLGDTAPTSDQYNLSICEILPAVAVSAAQLTPSTTALSYGGLVDGTSKALSLTLTSSGTAAVTISSLTVAGTSFSIPTETLPQTLTPGQTLTIPVTFAPTTAGALTGKLTVVSTSTTSPTSTVALSGTGTTPQLAMSATALSYGNVTDGTSKSQSLTLTSIGTANVSITSLAVSGTGYSIAATTLPKVLAPGQTLVVPVTFAPTTAGALTGKLTVVSTSTTSPTLTVALSGTGTAAIPQLTLSAPTLSFGSLTDGTSKALSLTLTSSGTANVSITSLAVSGTGYSIAATTLPKVIAHGHTLVVPVTFAPTTAGALTGKLRQWSAPPPPAQP